jgi:hypothetical protein
MSNTVKLKRSAVASKIPSTSDLALGELALNTYDGNLFFKKSVSGTDSIVSVATIDGTQTLSNKTLSSPTVTGTITAGGGVGTNGQVLTSTGTGVHWTTPSGGGGGSGNAFTTIAVSGQDDILAETSTETLTVEVRGVLSATTDATTKTLTISTARSFFPFTKYDGYASNIPLYTETTTVENSLNTVFLPFIKADGSPVTTLKLTA